MKIQKKLPLIAILGSVMVLSSVVPVSAGSGFYRHHHRIKHKSRCDHAHGHHRHHHKRRHHHDHAHRKHHRDHYYDYDDHAKRHRHFRDEHYHDYEFHGNVTHLPFAAASIKVGNVKLYYHDGVFYRKCRHGYDIIPAPIGACIRKLPFRHIKHYNRGDTYYSFSGVYYKKAPGGYVVIEKPYTSVSWKIKIGTDTFFKLSI